MKSPDIEEQEETDVYGNFAPRNDFSAGEMTKQKASTHRSKHSETEQRRRIKINERFQTLMDLIPQNDQKRDKASFLLEVIEYIQFLQEKLQMYEGSIQMWNHGPTKLTPWRNNYRPVEDSIDHSQAIKNWSIHENSMAPQPVLSDVNTLESDIDSFPVYNPPDHGYALAASTISSYTKTETDMSASVRSIMPAQPQTQSDDIHEQPNLKPENSVRFSSVYSQGVLNTLTEAFQASGVDLSRTTISVQLNVAKRASHEPSVATSTSKDNVNQIPASQVDYQTGVRRSYEHSDQAQKRARR